MVSIVPLYMVIDDLIRILKTSRKINSNFWKMRKYENFGILTNKRWIQKSVYVESSGGVDGISVDCDIGWINVSKIKTFHVSPEKKSKVFIHFFATEDIFVEESNLSLVIPKEQYIDLLAKLKRIINISQEDYNKLANGDLTYYLSKKD